MIWTEWEHRWLAAINACKQLGGNTYKLKIDPPAKLSEIEAVEKRMGFKLPISLKTILSNYSSNVEFFWYKPTDFTFPPPFDDIFRGDCNWNLNSLEVMEKERKYWVEMCFPDPLDSYNAVWYNKLPFLSVSNGDIIAIDLNCGDDGPVVYLSHDKSIGHGYLLGENFIDFIDKWTCLGCPGSEDWQILPFISDSGKFIDPKSKNAQEWKKLFGI